MESNNIIAAPQIADIDALFAIWKREHGGTLLDFVDFMTTPSVERDMFVGVNNPELKVSGSVAGYVLTGR